MNPKKCNTDGYTQCLLPSHKHYDECILHFSKEDAQYDYHMAREDLSLFKKKLLNDILNVLFAHRKEEEKFNRKNVSTYLKGDHLPIDEFLEEKIKEQVVVFNHIAFPVYDERDNWSYVVLLQRLGKIHFNYCKFYVSWVKLPKIEVYFQDCMFYDCWNLQNYVMLENVDNVIYQCCDFQKRVCYSSSEGNIYLEHSQFKNCTFTNIEFENTIFKKPLFQNSIHFSGNIAKLSFQKCIHQEELILKYVNIEYYDIYKCIFQNKFEMEKVTAQEMRIRYSFFKSLFELLNCTFIEFFMYKSTYEAFSSFEFSQFGSFKRKEAVSAQFEYVTFRDFVNFRSAIFNGGLELSRANFKEYPNFLYVDINGDNTDVETFRIVKHSFDKVGNTTEANRYFALEMSKQKKETIFWDDPEKKIILFLNMIFSHYGQSYLLPFIWICMLTIAYALTIDFAQTFSLKELFPNNHQEIQSIINDMNSFAKNIIPYQKFLKVGMEFISLIFLLLYTVFIYHFIVAVKRRTKR